MKKFYVSGGELVFIRSTTQVEILLPEGSEEITKSDYMQRYFEKKKAWIMLKVLGMKAKTIKIKNVISE